MPCLTGGLRGELPALPGPGCSLCSGTRCGKARRSGVPSLPRPPATMRSCASPPPVTSYIISQANHDGSEPNCHGTLAGDNCRQDQNRTSLTSRPGALLEKSSPGWKRLPQQPDTKRPSPAALRAVPFRKQRASRTASASPERTPPSPRPPAPPPCPRRSRLPP